MDIKDYYQKIRDIYNTHAKQYKKLQGEFYTRLSRDQSRKMLYRFLKEIGELEWKVVLDVGCGFGQDFKLLKSFGLDVYGIDISEKMIELAKGDFPELQDKLYVGNFEETSFQDEFFDIIFSRYALEYSFDLEKTFREFHRILKTNGIILCLCAHPFSLFFAQKQRVYGNHEIVKLNIYKDKFTIEKISHTFLDFFNKFVLENFTVLRFYEQPCWDSTIVREVDSEEVVPDYFILMLRKK